MAIIPKLRQQVLFYKMKIPHNVTTLFRLNVTATFRGKLTTCFEKKMY